MSQVEIVIRYDGRIADDGKLRLYDAGESLSGLATLVNLVSHSFANKNEVRDRVPNPVGVTTTMVAAQKGCFENVIGVEFSDVVVGSIGKTVIAKHFWSYLEFCLQLALGKDAETDSPFVRKISESEDTPFEELAVRLENPLKNLMRPIWSEGASTITFNRPHVGDRIVLDEDSYEYVNVSERDVALKHWIGNVTKYNILSGYGRVYLDEEKRTVPFNILEFDKNERAHKAATASMNERAQKIGEGKRVFVAHKVTNAPGRIKRLLVNEINLPHGE